uniref:Small ribosomal subunit protein mS38 n=1 Tax=Mycena chlorophos TaxID=658473 RepID=A0ABQ0LRV1_MYCCL|nr:predicted protein [Mycena chlorophos]
MSALAGRLRQLHSFPVGTAARRPYSSFFSKPGGGRYFNGPHKQATKPVASKDAAATPTEGAPEAPNAPSLSLFSPDESRLRHNTTHPLVELKDLQLHRFFSLHRPLLLLHNPATIFASPPDSAPLEGQRHHAGVEEEGAEHALRQPPDSDADVARQLARAITMSRAGAVVSWESTLQHLGISTHSISADSTKRKRRKKMKKHKLRKRRKLTRAQRLKLQ